MQNEHGSQFTCTSCTHVFTISEYFPPFHEIPEHILNFGTDLTFSRILDKKVSLILKQGYNLVLTVLLLLFISQQTMSVVRMNETVCLKHNFLVALQQLCHYVHNRLS